MWHLTACKISVHLSFWKWNDFWNDFLSYLWINVETNWNFTGCQMPYFMITLIPYINLLNLSWINNVYFWHYGAFKYYIYCKYYKRQIWANKPKLKLQNTISGQGLHCFATHPAVFLIHILWTGTQIDLFKF